VSKDGRKKERRRSGTTMRNMGEGEETLWSEGTASKRNSNEHGGVNDMGRSSDLCKV